MFERTTLARIACAGLLALGGLGISACDEEDARDVQEGVEDVGNELEKGADEVEEQIDENVDTDGKDD